MKAHAQSRSIRGPSSVPIVELGGGKNLLAGGFRSLFYKLTRSRLRDSADVRTLSKQRAPRPTRPSRKRNCWRWRDNGYIANIETVARQLGDATRPFSIAA